MEEKRPIILNPLNEMTDEFTCYFAFRPGEERLNRGQWQPAGTLAATVFLFPRDSPMGRRLSNSLRRKWLKYVSPSPKEDLRRLLAALTILQPKGSARLRIRFQLQQVRDIAESVVGLAADAPYGATANPILVAAQKSVRWVAFGRRSEGFRVTPTGAVFLSVITGWRRGNLRLCRSCSGLTAFPRASLARTCRECREIFSRGGRVAIGFARLQAGRWRKAAWRMRRRGFKRRGLDSHERQEWAIVARAALRQARTPKDLDAWEQVFAPKGEPGRPRKPVQTVRPLP